MKTYIGGFSCMISKACDEPRRVVVKIAGELDVYTSQKIKQRVANLLSISDEVIVDLGRVDYIDSTAIGMMVGWQRTAEKFEHKLVIVCPKLEIRKSFEIKGLDKVFDIREGI